MSNRSELATSACRFCGYGNSTSSSSEVVLPRTYSELNKVVCGYTRTGIACGRCQENYTVHFHSSGFLCKPAEPAGCKFGWFFYILSELIPLTVVFICVLILNIRFTSGATNGFILFSQLLGTFDIDASGIAAFSDSVKHQINDWTQGYQIICGIFNLNIFNFESLSFCLWKGASALDMLAFKYFSILYILLLIMLVVWIMNKCGGRCCGRYCRITTVKASVVHGISTFFEMCYAHCLSVSLGLLVHMDVGVKEGSDFKPYTRVWLNGEIVYFSKEHLPYALPALFCLLIVGLLPPCLLYTSPSPRDATLSRMPSSA